MEIQVSPQITNLVPNFKLGMIEYNGITVVSPQMLKGRLQLFQESIYFDLDGKTVKNVCDSYIFFKKLKKRNATFYAKRYTALVNI